MENDDLEQQIRNLAYDIWRSAGSEFSRTALDFWTMAERMVIELTADSVRHAKDATAIALESATNETFSPADYLEQIRRAAYHLWETAQSQHHSALDFWLTAEQQILEALATDATAAGADRSASAEAATH